MSTSKAGLHTRLEVTRQRASMPNPYLASCLSQKSNGAVPDQMGSNEFYSLQSTRKIVVLLLWQSAESGISLRRQPTCNEGA